MQARSTLNLQMMKWLRLAAWLVVSASAGWAVDWAAYKPEGFVSDFAKVIDPASKAQLERYAGAVQRASGVQMAFVTVASLEGEPIEEVANAIARAWGVGQKGQNEGVLLLLAIRDRRSRLEIGYGLEPILPDGLSGSILREMRPALRQEHYGQALFAAAQTLGGGIAKAKNVSIDSTLPRRIPRTSKDTFPWPMIVGGLILVAWLMRAGRPRGYSGQRGWRGNGFLPGLILGNMMGRSTWGSRGSGGFGGYDSSDGGFGGFGGGDFGGGGASSDW
jgi:uncharacterized protein